MAEGVALSSGFKVTRQKHMAAELRVVASKRRDGEQKRRHLALALVLDGVSRSETAAQNGIDRQTLRDWVAPVR